MFHLSLTSQPHHPPGSDITSHFLLTDTGVYLLRAFPIEPTPRCIWTSLSLPLLQSNIKPTKPSMSPSPAPMAALFPSLSPGSPGGMPCRFKADVRRQIPRISFSYTGPPPIDKQGSHSSMDNVYCCGLLSILAFAGILHIVFRVTTYSTSQKGHSFLFPVHGGGPNALRSSFLLVGCFFPCMNISMQPFQRRGQGNNLLAGKDKRD